MNKIDNAELLSFLKSICPNAQGTFIDPNEVIFEENVKMNCFYCGNYGKNWKCPPLSIHIDFPKMFSEFNIGLLVCLVYSIDKKEERVFIRNESSRVIHRTLLELERYMLNHNHSNVLSFIGGSCKLCKDGCGKERCSNPYMARSPLEAIGINVVKTARKYGIELSFPVDKILKRIGLLLW